MELREVAEWRPETPRKEWDAMRLGGVRDSGRKVLPGLRRAQQPGGRGGGARGQSRGSCLSWRPSHRLSRCKWNACTHASALPPCGGHPPDTSYANFPLPRARAPSFNPISIVFSIGKTQFYGHRKPISTCIKLS